MRCRTDATLRAARDCEPPGRWPPSGGCRGRTTKGTTIAKRVDTKDTRPARSAVAGPMERAAEAAKATAGPTVVVRRFRRGRWTLTALPV